VETMIRSSILERYPDHSFLGEETYAKDKQISIGDGFTWIVDPIDVSDSNWPDTSRFTSS
jgi:myo-inositol-1(or 4)-monophosphatase